MQFKTAQCCRLNSTKASFNTCSVAGVGVGGRPGGGGLIGRSTLLPFSDTMDVCRGRQYHIESTSNTAGRLQKSKSNSRKRLRMETPEKNTKLKGIESRIVTQSFQL